MKGRAVLILALALAGCGDDPNQPAGPSLAGPVLFSAPLLASNEVPPVSNAEAGARGNVTISFDVPRDAAGNITGGGTATFALQLSGFPPGTAAIAAHIHPGAAGVNGPVLVNTTLTPTAPIVMNDGTAIVTLTAPVTEAQAEQVTANPGSHYFNVHTPSNPGGAVRGQLTRVQ